MNRKINKQSPTSQVTFQPGDKVVHGKYHIYHHIGLGQHSAVYSIGLKRKGTQLFRAIKIVTLYTLFCLQEHQSTKNPQIYNQIQVLRSMQDVPGADIGFPKLYQYGAEVDYNYIVLELLGPNLQQLLTLSGGKFSFKTVLIIGLQILDRLETLHNGGWVYIDMQPSNFVMGIQNKSVFVHMVGFGKCKRFKNQQGTHILYKESTKFDGQFQFSSLNTHTKTQYSRRDDIQALIYMMIYMKKGRLPWSITKDHKTKKQRESIMQQLKKKIPSQNLTYKMPLQFNDLLSYIRTLNFFQKPDYDYIRSMLQRCFNLQDDEDKDNIQSEQQSNKMSIEYDWGKLEGLDFVIYLGHPKIIQRNQDQQNQQALESKFQLFGQSNSTYKSLKPNSSADVDIQTISKDKIPDPNSTDSKQQQLDKLQRVQKVKKMKNQSNHIFDFLDNFR